MKRIAVITANKELARFFELELTMLGCMCEMLRSISLLPRETYDLVFFDADTQKITDIEHIDCEVAVVAKDVASITDDDIRVISWPSSIEEIADICRGNGCGEKNKSTSAYGSCDVLGTLYVIDRERYTVAMGNRYIKLSKSEFGVLEMLCKNVGETVERWRISELLGADEGNISDVYICNIRKKLEADGAQRVIFTVRGKGYRTTLRLVD